MIAKLVTGYVPLPNQHQWRDFHTLGKRLTALPVSKQVYVWPIEKCWLYKYLQDKPDVKPVISGNPEKDTLNFHIICHQKIEWMLKAAQEDITGANVFAWVDYGILHLPGVTEELIVEFLRRAEGEKGISMPGCIPAGPVPDDRPCWRFCGGVIVANRQRLTFLNDAIKDEVAHHAIHTHCIPWDVNTYARVELRNPGFIRWYAADHNEKIFMGY